MTADFGEANKAVVTLISEKVLEGPYAVKATLGEQEVKGTFTVDKQEVKEVKITNKDNIALIKATLDETAVKTALVYYEIIDNYGNVANDALESSISWVLSAKELQGTPANGVMEIKGVTKGDKITIKAFVGTDVMGEQEIEIGDVQSLYTVSFDGLFKAEGQSPVEHKGYHEIIDTKDPLKDFNGEYCLLYRALDQNGGFIDPDIATAGAIRFVARDDNKILDQTGEFENFKKGHKYTKDGIDYYALTIKAADDKAYIGGTVTITATLTSGNVPFSFIVSSKVRLKELKLTGAAGSDPERLIDGKKTEILFTATDSEDKAITTYDSIVETANTLYLTASKGDLWIEEDDDGNARMYWDGNINVTSVEKINLHVTSDENTTDSQINLNLNPASYPKTISEIKVNKEDNKTFVVGATCEVDFASDDYVTYVDQYNEVMPAKDAYDYLIGKGATLSITPSVDEAFNLSSETLDNQNSRVSYTMNKASNFVKATYLWSYKEGNSDIKLDVSADCKVVNLDSVNSGTLEVEDLPKLLYVEADNSPSADKPTRGTLEIGNLKPTSIKVTGKVKDSGEVVTIPNAYYTITGGSIVEKDESHLGLKPSELKDTELTSDKPIVSKSFWVQVYKANKNTANVELLGLVMKQVDISNVTPEYTAIDFEDKVTVQSGNDERGQIAINDIVPEQINVINQYGQKKEENRSEFQCSVNPSSESTYSVSGSNVSGVKAGDKFTLIINYKGNRMEISVTVGADKKKVLHS